MMVDEKTVAMSEAPTLAPSATTSVREKVDDASSSESSSHHEPDTSEVVATEAVDGEPEPTEKTETDLAKHATVKSHAGESVAQIATREDGSEYPTGMKLGLIILALCLSVFLMALDNSIIATAIPKITDEFRSLPDVGWYGSAYLLTTASLQLLFGKFYSFFSIKWVYLVAIALFELGSLICGVAQNSTTLILGRAVAGVGSAGIFSGALIILAYSVPLAKRPMWTGAVGSMFGIASVSGPLLGGVFTDRVTWRWCFFINLPIGAITIFVIAIFFPDPTRAKEIKDETWGQRIKQMDPIGTIIFMPAVICLLLALQWGGTQYEWNSGRIIALFVLFGVLIICFLYVQGRQGDLATIPPRIIRKRSVWTAALYSFSIGSAFMCTIYFLPIWFQAVKGASAVSSGIMNLPMLISLVLCSVVAGAMVTIYGYYTPFMIIGTVLASVGYGLISTFKPDTSEGVWIGYQILAGAGVGLGMQQPLMAVQTVLTIKDVPMGTSVVIFLQTLGGALFVSIGENVFSNKLVTNVPIYAPGIDPKSLLVVGATQISTIIPADKLAGVIIAYSDALTQAFMVSAAMASISAIGAAFIEWKSVKGKNISAGGAV